MDDIPHEEMFPFSVHAKETPNRSGGKGVNVSAYWRWSSSGCRNILLESWMIGGIRMTSREAVRRFFAAVTAAADKDKHSRTPRESEARRTQRADAERILREAGI